MFSVTPFHHNTLISQLNSNTLSGNLYPEDLNADSKDLINSLNKVFNVIPLGVMSNSSISSYLINRYTLHVLLV